MRRVLGCSIVLGVLLAGCVQVQPFVSPLTFDSPPQQTAIVHRIYLPLYIAPANKRGVSLACGYEDPERMAREVAALGVSWVWNWEPNPPVFSGVESVPTLWDAADIGQSLGGNSEWLLGFNEPDQWDQANMTPVAAARAWARVEAIYPERKLGSPQVVQPERHWLEDFYVAYQAQNDGEPPPLDAILVHTYWGNNIEDYKRQVLYYIDLAKKWGIKEVWVTEFAIAANLERSSHASVLQLAEFVTWLDAQPLVTRYAVWTNRVECVGIAAGGVFDTPLFAVDGTLTEAGRVYRRGGSTWQ